MSTSYGTITITNETEAKKAARYFLHSSGGSYVIAGNSQSFNPSDESTYGFNVRSGTNEIQLRYNNKVLSEWSGGDGTQNSNLVFYDTTNAASTQLALKKLMELTSVGLNFYKKGDDSTAAASLTANGLEIKEGSISLGNILSTGRYPFEVNSNGELYANNATVSGVIIATSGVFNGDIYAKAGSIGGWNIQDYVDYNQTNSFSNWTVTNYNQTKTQVLTDSTFELDLQTVIPGGIYLKFSGSLNGLNISDNNQYNYHIDELDTEYTITYSNVDVGKAKITFDGNDIILYVTKTLDDDIVLELKTVYFTTRDDSTGALYYSSSVPGQGTSSIVLSGKGIYSPYSVGGSEQGLVWRMAAGTDFGVDDTGCLYATNATISGYINAGSGSIGGWKIGGDTAHSLWYSSSSSITTPAAALGSGLILSPGGIYSSTQPGGSTSLLPADKTWAFTAGNKFGVTTDGELYGSGANLSNINVGTIAISDVSGLSSALSSAASSATYYIGSKTTPDDSAIGIAIAQSNPTNATTFNFLNTDGMRIYKDNIKLASFDNTGMSLYRIGNNEGIKIANFGSTIRLGQERSINLTIDPNDGLYFNNNYETYGSIIYDQWNGNTPGLKLSGLGVGGTSFGNTSLVLHHTGAMLLATTDESLPVRYGAGTNWVVVSSNEVNIGTGGAEISIGTGSTSINVSGKLYNTASFGYYRAVFSGTDAPSSSTGAIGDIYIKYTS